MRVASYATKHQREGFTIIELMIVIVLITILAGIVIVALNPKKNLAETGDAKRQVDLKTLVDALYQYQIDHGEFPIIDTT